MTTTAIDLFTTATYADLRLAMMQAGDDHFTVTVLGVELDCDCNQDPDEHPIRPAAWVRAVEEYDDAGLVDMDELWFRARVNDAVQRELDRELDDALNPITRESVLRGIQQFEAWVKAEGYKHGL